MITTSKTWLPNDLHNTVAYNPLVAIAAPILTIAHQLSEQTSALKNRPELFQTLINELKRYYDQAHQLGYDAKHILTSRYWLCVTLDSFIAKLPNPKKVETPPLLNQLNYRMGNNQFFVLLQEHQRSAKPVPDILELGYLCLALGYIDPLPSSAPHDTDDIRRQLVKQIHQLRITKKSTPIKNTRKTVSRYIIILIAVLTGIALFAIHHHVNVELTPIKQAFQLVQYFHDSHLYEGFS